MKTAKKLAAVVLAAIMAVAMALPVLAYEGEEDFVFTPLVGYSHVTGEVSSVEETENGTRILVTTEESSAYFTTTLNTFFLGETPNVGDRITGFFENNMPMTMIYPPQYRAVVIVNNEEITSSVFVDRFVSVEGFEDDDSSSPPEMLSLDGTRRLHASNPETIIVSQGGQDATDWDLNDRLLVVVYDLATRSMPPLIFAPEKIVVMYEVAVHPIGDISGMDLGLGLALDLELDVDLGIDAITDEIGHIISIEEPFGGVIVNGATVPNVETYSDNELGLISHVAIRTVANAIDPNMTIEWDNGRVLLNGIWGNISFVAGASTITVDGRIVTLDQPTVTFAGRVFVPLSFFREVAGMNNAFELHGNVFINNDEVME